MEYNRTCTGFSQRRLGKEHAIQFLGVIYHQHSLVTSGFAIIPHERKEAFVTHLCILLTQLLTQHTCQKMVAEMGTEWGSELQKSDPISTVRVSHTVQCCLESDQVYKDPPNTVTLGRERGGGPSPPLGFTAAWSSGVCCLISMLINTSHIINDTETTSSCKDAVCLHLQAWNCCHYFSCL